jgi:hypothetical protein
MRRVTLVMLVAVLAAAGVAGDAAGKRRACNPKGSTTVAKTRAVRVFEREGSVYGCLLSTGRARVLDEDDGLYKSVGLLHIAGRYVAWGFDYVPECKADCPPGTTGTTYLGVLDLRSGRRRTADAEPSDLVLTRSGAVAWIDGGALNAWDRRGTRVLDPGPVTSRRLRLVDSLVLWRTAAGGRWEQLAR